MVESIIRFGSKVIGREEEDRPNPQLSQVWQAVSKGTQAETSRSSTSHGPPATGRMIQMNHFTRTERTRTWTSSMRS